MSRPLPEYGFEPYLESLSDDWYADDPLLRRLLEAYAPGAEHGRAADWGRVTAGRLRRLAELSALPENAPALRHHDAYRHRIDEVVLPGSTRAALEAAHREAGLGAVRGDAFVHYALIYLLAQNGEAGVACSVGCTDGLVRALDVLGDGEMHRLALRRVREPGEAGFEHGAQFVTEVQGGSDVPANRLRAVADGDGFRLHGGKWFCSNINADWFLVTGRPDGAPPDGSGVALFLVPAYRDMLPGAGSGGLQAARLRNGYTVDRLKDKLGTRELATAEVTFDGAVAWPVGPLDRGLPNLLRHVLTPSRYHCVLYAAGALRQAERVAGAYTRFREAFGRPIARYPLVSRTVTRIEDARAAALACAFELLRLWRAAEAGGYEGQDAADFRVLLSLMKPALTRRCTELLHEAMMLLAGNGIEERFSPLPRLFRDSVIMETWEGPHNVLYTQALRDLKRFGMDPGAFVERVAPGAESASGLADRLAAALEETDDGVGAARVADAAPDLVAAVAAAAIHRVPRPGNTSA